MRPLLRATEGDAVPHQMGVLRTWWNEGHVLFPMRFTRTKDYDLTWVGRACNRYRRITRWVRWSWWRYVLSAPQKRNPTPRRFVAWCRLRGHPNGYIYFNPGGMEPDYRCKDCLEDIVEGPWFC